EAELTFNVQFERFHANEWIVFAAQAPVLPGQVKVKTTMQPRQVIATELGPLHRPILMARVPARGGSLAKSISIQVNYDATLRSRRLRALRPDESPPVIPELSGKERRAALLDGGDYDFKSKPFQEWLEARALRRGAEENEVDFALRVFQVIRSFATYD